MGKADVSALIVRCLPTVLAGVQETIQHGYGMVQDGAGNYYLAYPILQVIHKVSPDGRLSVYTGMPGMGDGTALLALGRDANLYVADNCNGL